MHEYNDIDKQRSILGEMQAMCIVKNDWFFPIDIAEKALKQMQERDNPKPLTLAELKQMEGEPVWIKDYRTGLGEWHIVENVTTRYIRFSGICIEYGWLYENYLETWVAYAHKPKEGE